MQIDLAKTVEYLPEDVCLFEPFELVGEQEFVEEDVADVGREFGDVVDQILVELAGILTVEGFESEAAQIVDLDVAADGPEQDHVAGGIVYAFGQAFRGLQNRRLGGLKDTVEPSHHDERQDDLAVIGLLEVAPEDLGDRPYERGEGLGLGSRAVHEISFG